MIESADVGAMDALGIGYESLAKINPGLIYVAVTPYGSTGPKAGWAATDITVAAATGPMIQSGDRDRPPLIARRVCPRPHCTPVPRPRWAS